MAKKCIECKNETVVDMGGEKEVKEICTHCGYGNKFNPRRD